MYKIEKIAYGRFNAHRLINTSNNQYFEVLTDFGAGTNDLVLSSKSGQLVSVISGYRSESDVLNTHHSKFAGSKLSPFPNRIKEGQFSFKGVDYQLPVNEYGIKNHLHGFLHNKKYNVLKELEAEHEASLTLGFDYLGTIQGFPFPYSIQINYVLNNSGLQIMTSIENTGLQDMPIGDGWHPYFVFNDLDQVKLKIGKAERVSSLIGNELSSEHGFESVKSIGSQAFDDCFSIDNGDRFEISMEDEKEGVELTVWQNPGVSGYAYCQIYTPPSRKEIAIEPVSCPPDAINTNESIVILKSGESVTMAMGIDF